MPSSRGSSRPRVGTQVSHFAGRFFTISATNKVWGAGAVHSDEAVLEKHSDHSGWQPQSVFEGDYTISLQRRTGGCQPSRDGRRPLSCHVMAWKALQVLLFPSKQATKGPSCQCSCPAGKTIILPSPCPPNTPPPWRNRSWTKRLSNSSHIMSPLFPIVWVTETCKDRLFPLKFLQPSSAEEDQLAGLSG